jgi:hypothetical protein
MNVLYSIIHPSARVDGNRPHVQTEAARTWRRKRQIRDFLQEDTGDPFLFADLFRRVGLYRMRVDVLVGNEEWNLPPGLRDLSLLSHPETLTNVANGFGFVAGGYREDRLFYPSREALERSRFSDSLLGRRDGSRGSLW